MLIEFPCTRYDNPASTDVRVLGAMSYAAGKLRYADEIMPLIARAHDHKGELTVYFSAPLPSHAIASIRRAWAEYAYEPKEHVEFRPANEWGNGHWHGADIAAVHNGDVDMTDAQRRAAVAAMEAERSAGFDAAEDLLVAGVGAMRRISGGLRVI